MDRLAKTLTRLVLGDYSAYHIYTFEAALGRERAREVLNFEFASVDKSQVEASNDLSIAERALYHGAETHAYACLLGQRIVSLCYFWHGARYRTRNFWPLLDNEAKLVEIVTVPDMRGRGAASLLINYASEQMLRNGFQRLYARIWHSNVASTKAFRRAGWVRVATVIEVNPLRRRAPFRITRRTRGR